MCRLLLVLLTLSLSASAQEVKIAVFGLLHSHVWGHLPKMIQGQPARPVGIAETNPELIAEAKKMGAPGSVFHGDPARMLDETKPDTVWAFNENSQHRKVVELCAPRKIHVIFEKPLAATLADSLAIRQLVERHKIKLTTNYQMAWWPS